MTEPRPYTLVAELTYACPLACAYCSNPIERLLSRTLDHATWTRVFEEAADLGVLQVHLTGGEPLLRKDLEQLVGQARSLDLFVVLITSGLPLSFERLQALKNAGLDAIQLSFQDVLPEAARRISGVDALQHKCEVARWARSLGLPLTVNVVLHRENIERVPRFIELAHELGADRLELANTQYLGFAFQNREALLPDRSQIETARAHVQRERERPRGQMDLAFVLPDYHAGRPRACMNGWGNRYIVVSPDGVVMPCHAAASIRGLNFERVTERSLSSIWNESPSFRAFRGEAWMKEPCKSCDRRETDFGGCRCQAFLLTGDASATDPACALSPHHESVSKMVQGSPSERLVALRLRPSPRPAPA